MIWLLIRAVLPLGLLVSGFLLAERMVIYAFDPRVVDPATLDLALTEERFETAKGDEMVIWRAEPDGDKPTILYLHGNAGNLANRHQRFKIILSRGYGLVAPGYPGSSGSEGWPTQAKLIDGITDIYLSLTSGQMTGEPVLPVVYGESIGAAVALHVMANDRLLPAQAVILEAPFTSLEDVARDLNSWMQVLTTFLTSRWESIEVAPALAAPLLVLHGSEDELIPISQGRAIFEAAASEDKEFYQVDGAGHLDVWKVTTQRHLFDWLDLH